MRESRYNVWVERNGSSFVYNGVSGGLLPSLEGREGTKKKQSHCC